MKQQGSLEKTAFWGPLFLKMAAVFSVAILLLGVTYGVLELLKPERFPISTVKIVGKLDRLARDPLQALITEHVAGGFFRLDVGALRTAIEALPWARSAYVKRSWPSSVVVEVEEHFPFARWNEEGVMTREGVLITPPKKTIPPHLPLLKGPLGRHFLVWEQYRVMMEVLAPSKHTIVRLELARRGSWKVYLENGLHIILGKVDVLARLERFAKAYQEVLEPLSRRIAYVDLRYTSGLAVGWKGESQEDG